MRKYMDVHEGFVGVTQEQFDAAHRLDLEAQGAEGVSFDKAWLDPVTGTAFCLSRGPSKEAVMRVHAQAGHPAAQVYELASEV